MVKLLSIAVGGALGSVLRYLVSGWTQRWTDQPVPLGTLIVNVAGCFVIGLLATLLTGPVIVREEWRLLVLVGLLGGFTTFSTFAFETAQLLGDGQYAFAVLNVTLSNLLGLAGVWIGLRASQALFGP